MRSRISRAHQMIGLVVAAFVAFSPAVASVPQAAQADPDDISRSENVKLVENVPKRSPLDDAFNSDIAFWGDYAFQGNYDGFTIWDISRPRSPQVVSQVLCPGGQGDISVTPDGSLLFFSVDYARSSDSCGSEPASSGDASSWEGMRIFDISNLLSPDYVGAVATDCGSHTNTLVPDKAGEAVYLYVSSYGPSDRFPNCQPPHDSISIIEVPLEDPGAASVVAEPVLFPDGGAPGTSGCHDITVYPQRDIAAGACMGNGVLMDISDPVAPQVIDRVSDPNFAFWHSATFSNHGTKVVFTDELGGGGAATCNEEVGPERGADAVFDIAGAGGSRELLFRSYFKIPRNQADTENCVAHNGSLIPVKGRDVMVQAWYQGGVSVFDFTDSSNPREIGHFDRGPLSDEFLTVGGSWSAYYYNGYIYSSDIEKGLDVIKVKGQRGAGKVTFDVLNAQTQERYAEGRQRSKATPNKKDIARRDSQAAPNGAGIDRRDRTEAPVVVPGAPGDRSRSVTADKAPGLERTTRARQTGKGNTADREFMQMMIPHHYQAVVMSELARSRSGQTPVKAIADRMRVEQDLEIGSMQGWQGRNGLTVTSAQSAYQRMLNNPAMLDQMGMATRAQIKQLRGSDGAEFDALFLKLMIRHHEGAVSMAEDVNVDGSDLFIRQMSTDMLVGQGAQIDEMEQMQNN